MKKIFLIGSRLHTKQINEFCIYNYIKNTSTIYDRKHYEL